MSFWLMRTFLYLARLIYRSETMLVILYLYWELAVILEKYLKCVRLLNHFTDQKALNGLRINIRYHIMCWWIRYISKKFQVHILQTSLNYTEFDWLINRVYLTIFSLKFDCKNLILFFYWLKRSAKLDIFLIGWNKNSAHFDWPRK